MDSNKDGTLNGSALTDYKTATVVSSPFDYPGVKQQLLAQKEAVLEEIRALDFDYDTGKIPQEVYEPQRTHLMGVATEILKSLDELGTEAPQDDVAAQIEAAINRVRVQRHTGQDMLVSKAAVPTNGSVQFCTQCGAKVDANDKFCAACGSKLAVPV